MKKCKKMYTKHKLHKNYQWTVTSLQPSNTIQENKKQNSNLHIFTTEFKTINILTTLFFLKIYADV